MSAAALAAAVAASRATDRSVRWSASSVVARAAASSAAEAAVAYANADPSTEVSAAAAAAAVAAANAATSGSVNAWSAVIRDAEWLTAHRDEGLVDWPLWLEDVRENGRYETNMPAGVRSALDGFANSRLAERYGFSPWIAWYRAILPNTALRAPRDYFGEALTLRIVGQTNEWWERPASEVNADISEWLNERQSDPEFDRDLKTALENLPTQTPAAYRFLWQDGRIRAEPPDPSPGDSAVAQDLLDETRRKAEALTTTLKQSNADPYVHRSVCDLLGVLPAAVGDLRPGLLLSRARSVEAIAAAYAGSDGEQELFPGAVAQVLDLSETVRDLQGCLPEIREIEAERLALEIDPRNVDEVGKLLEDIVDAAVTDQDVVDESAKEALRTMTNESVQDAPIQVRQRLIADRALVVRNFASRLYRQAIESRLAAEAAEMRTEYWNKVRPKLVDVAVVGSAVVAVVGVSTIAGHLAGPVAVLGVLVYGFRQLGKSAKLLEESLSKDESGADDVAGDDVVGTAPTDER